VAVVELRFDANLISTRATLEQIRAAAEQQG